MLRINLKNSDYGYKIIINYDLLKTKKTHE